ncbi:hypothetical protein [Bradyrhizobium sp. USDA 4473]
MVSTQFKIVTSLGIAAMFAVISFALGFSMSAAFATALASGVSARVVMSALNGEARPSPEGALARAYRRAASGEMAELSARAERDGRPRTVLVALLRVSLAGSLCQRIASGAFLAQAAIGAVAIVLFWLGQTMAFDMRLFAMASPGSLFADGIPMSIDACLWSRSTPSPSRCL